MTFAFRYIERPHEFSTYQEEPRTCDLCGSDRPGYGEPFYGPGEITFVCEECLATGKLQRHNISTNQGDAGTLAAQLRESLPALDDAEREQIVRERTAELEHRTPLVVTWQDFFWPAHCGDYCRFIKEVGQPELASLSSDGNGPMFLAAHVRDIEDLDHALEIWDDIRPDNPADGSLEYSLGVYLFQCLTCGEYVLLWDRD